MYRDRKWNRKQKQKEKSLKKKNWYKRGGVRNFRTALFVESTPGSELIKRLTKREAELNKNKDWRNKIVGKGVQKQESILQKNYPFAKELCKSKCFPCQSMIGSNKKSNCKVSSVGYEIPCKTCKRRGVTKVYAGESSKNGNGRGSEHVRVLKNKIPTNPLYKHKLIDHAEEGPEFHMNIL